MTPESLPGLDPGGKPVFGMGRAQWIGRKIAAVRAGRNG